MDKVFDGIVQFATSQLGLTGNGLITTLILISLAARLFAKWIPDNRTGFIGFIRDTCKVLGLYVSNRISTGISVGDVSKVIVDSKLPVRQEDGKFTSVTVEEAARKVQSPWPAVVIAVGLAALFLVGCTPRQKQLATQFAIDVCHDLPAAQAVLDKAAKTHDVKRAQQLMDALTELCPSILAKLNTDRAVQSGLLPLGTK